MVIEIEMVMVMVMVTVIPQGSIGYKCRGSNRALLR